MTTPSRCVPKAKVVARDITALKSPWHALDDACATPESRDAIAIVDVHVGTDRTRARTVELSSRATRLEVKTLAHALERARGVGKGSDVIVMLENSAAYIVATHACAGLGARVRSSVRG